MKYFICVLLLSLCSLSSAAEYGQLFPVDGYRTLTLESGDVVEVIALNTDLGGDSTLFIFEHTVVDTLGNPRTIRYSKNIISVFRGKLLTFVGPGSITTSVDLHYKLTRAPNPQSAAASTPAD